MAVTDCAEVVDVDACHTDRSGERWSSGRHGAWIWFAGRVGEVVEARRFWSLEGLDARCEMLMVPTSRAAGGTGDLAGGDLAESKSSDLQGRCKATDRVVVAQIWYLYAASGDVLDYSVMQDLMRRGTVRRGTL